MKLGPEVILKALSNCAVVGCGWILVICSMTYFLLSLLHSVYLSLLSHSPLSS